MKSILRTAAAGMALASLGIASGASAATSDSAQVSAQILTSLSVAVDPADNTLNFGTVAPGATAVNVVVTPAGTRTCPAGVICGGTVNAPTFNIDGLGGALVNVSFANSTETLTSTGGDTLLVSALATSLGATNQATLNTTTGKASFTVGGSLAVAASQPAGTYTGSVTVNVAYN